MFVFKKVFNKDNPHWSCNVVTNEEFLNNVRIYLDTLLQNGEYVFLKDAYEFLGLPITRQSCTYGWDVVTTKHVIINIKKIEKTKDFQLIFECVPIIDYLPEESSH